MVMNLEQKNFKTKLVWYHFDLVFILDYNICIADVIEW